MKRSKIVLITLSFLVATIAYMFAPSNAQLGTYTAKLTFPNPTDYSQTEQVSFTFNLSDSKSVEWKEYVFNFREFNVTVYAKENYALSPTSTIEFKVKLTWHSNSAIKIASSLLVITIKKGQNFSVDVRPTRIEDDVYVFRYRPLVRSKEAFTILFLDPRLRVTSWNSSKHLSLQHRLSKIKKMLKAGLILDLISLLLLTFGIVWIWLLLGLVTI